MFFSIKTLQKPLLKGSELLYYIKWGFESRLKPVFLYYFFIHDYIKWGFESRLKPGFAKLEEDAIISNGDLRVD